MGKKLSDMLLANGFLMVLGTKEKSMTELEAVSYGIPYTFDSDNGYTVVYDEQGRPWWLKSSGGFFNGPEFTEICSTMFGLGNTMRRGAYVPHTDGLFLLNLKIAHQDLRKRLQSMGADAPIPQVIEAWRYEFGNLGSFAARELPKTSEALGVATIGELAKYTRSEISGPQARYTGNKTLSWVEAVFKEFDLQLRTF